MQLLYNWLKYSTNLIMMINCSIMVSFKKKNPMCLNLHSHKKWTLFPILSITRNMNNLSLHYPTGKGWNYWTYVNLKLIVLHKTCDYKIQKENEIKIVIPHSWKKLGGKTRQNMSLMSKLSDKVIIFFKDSFSKENIYL